MLLDVWPSDLLVEYYCPLSLSLTLTHSLFYSSFPLLPSPSPPPPPPPPSHTLTLFLSPFLSLSTMVISNITFWQTQHNPHQPAGRMVIHPTTPVSTSTPLLTGSCSIETLVSYLAYLLGLGHTGTREVNSQLWGAIAPRRKAVERQDNLHATGERSNFPMWVAVLRYSARQRAARWLKCGSC